MTVHESPAAAALSLPRKWSTQDGQCTVSLHTESLHNSCHDPDESIHDRQRQALDVAYELDEKLLRRIADNARKLFADIDSSFIIRQGGHQQRSTPTFSDDEISLGSLLGKGAFATVHELQDIHLRRTVNTVTSFQLAPLREDADDPADEDNPQCTEATTASAVAEAHAQPTPKASGSTRPSYQITSRPDDATRYDHVHYDIREARALMCQRLLRHNQPRYALKRLHSSLKGPQRARGMIDLAAEAKYLSILWHPNIVKLRAVAAGNFIDHGFFIIIDRLQETLKQRMPTWAAEEKKFRGRLFGRGRNKQALQGLMIARMTVAYDIAGALMYLHDNRIVYRDLKPENIGFDMRGDVKLFDFGLCKSLAPELKSLTGYGYQLTGRAGSLPYMAPEVVRVRTYDTKCDVFSFAILLWEILSLKTAFDGMSTCKFVDTVVMEGKRLPISKEWPSLTRLMIPEAWKDDPSERPSMSRVAVLLRVDLNDMTDDECIQHRTDYLQNRSRHSMHSCNGDGGNIPE